MLWSRECLSCSDTVQTAEQFLCNNCLRALCRSLEPRSLFVERHGIKIFAASRYEGIAQQLIAFLKSNPAPAIPEAAIAFCKRLVLHWGSVFQEEGVDLILPIPSSPFRCFGKLDLSYLMAKTLSDATQTQLSYALQYPWSRAFVPTGFRRSLSGRARRILFEQDGFKLQGPIHPESRILLVDDVITSGATLESAMKAIETHKHQLVGCFCLSLSLEHRDSISRVHRTLETHSL